ncbi:MAG: hypothetical protein A2178_03515 [Planctomycetes bacterium GWC2_49_10]|nr:MAG: hypothetical protein A2178_03515 [Planctomycetes bacterium GWC2_49_10]
MKKNAKLEIVAAQMIAVLQHDSSYLTAAVTRLNDMRESLIKRDPAVLEQLLAVIRSEQDLYALNEVKRNDLRIQAADELGLDPAQVNISILIEHLSPKTAQRLADAKAELEKLTAALRTEYIATASLLTECARFNRQLVNAVLGSNGTVTTYDSRGGRDRNRSTMMNFQL